MALVILLAAVAAAVLLWAALVLAVVAWLTGAWRANDRGRTDGGAETDGEGQRV